MCLFLIVSTFSIYCMYSLLSYFFCLLVLLFLPVSHSGLLLSFSSSSCLSFLVFPPLLPYTPTSSLVILFLPSPLFFSCFSLLVPPPVLSFLLFSLPVSPPPVSPSSPFHNFSLLLLLLPYLISSSPLPKASSLPPIPSPPPFTPSPPPSSVHLSFDCLIYFKDCFGYLL